MRPIWSIASREYLSMFRLPLGWIVTAIFVFAASMVFLATLTPGQPATMRGFFRYCLLVLVVLAPAISMRTLSEESRTGTIEPLLTSPVSEWSIVIGKYLGSVAFLLTMLLPSAVYVGVLEWLSRPDYGPILSGYLGVVLLGGLYLAVGMLVSALTASQTLAFLGTLFALTLMEMTAFVAQQVPQPWQGLLFSIGSTQRINDFARGLIDTGHIGFFLAAIVWFLMLAGVVLQSRRWR